MGWKDRLGRVGRVLGFLDDVRKHFEQDAAALLAAGLAFNGLLTLVPTLLLLTSVAAVFVSKDVDIYQRLIDYIRLVLPGIGDQVLNVIFDLVRNKEVIGVVGLVGLAWTSLRIFGSVRAALSRILRTRRGRPFFHGKVFDLTMVFFVGILLLISILLTSVLEAVEKYSADKLNLPGEIAHLPRSGALVMSAFMFFVLFRYVPAERVRVGSAALGAAVSAVLWEITKYGLTAYLTRVGDMSAIYGSVGLVVVLAMWGYYSAIAFVVGAEFVAVREERLAAATAPRQLPASAGGRGESPEVGHGRGESPDSDGARGESPDSDGARGESPESGRGRRPPPQAASGR